MNIHKSFRGEPSEVRTLSPELHAFVQTHKERLLRLTDEHEWLLRDMLPLFDDDLRKSGWYLSVVHERYERVLPQEITK